MAGQQQMAAANGRFTTNQAIMTNLLGTDIVLTATSSRKKTTLLESNCDKIKMDRKRETMLAAKKIHGGPGKIANNGVWYSLVNSCSSVELSSYLANSKKVKGILAKEKKKK